MIVSNLILIAAGLGIHVRVDGDGLLRFARGDQAVYARDIVLKTSSGVLASPEGYPLLPQIHVPTSGAGVQIGMDGSVSVGGKSVGRIVLASFGKALVQYHESYWVGTGRSSIGYPGEGVFGVIRSGSASQGHPSLVKPAITAITTIDVSFHSEIPKEQILLGDIAKIDGAGDATEKIAETDLGSTPIFGAQRGITRMYIMAKLRSLGINPDRMEIICPSGATVVRKGQLITDDTIVAAATDAVKTKLGIDYALRADRSVTDFSVSCGTLTFNARDAVQSQDGATVNLEILVDGKLQTSRTVYLVPVNPLPQVHAGDPIKIRVSKNGATVEVAGKARSNCKVGGTISVESENGASFTGVLRSVSVVEVKL